MQPAAFIVSSFFSTALGYACTDDEDSAGIVDIEAAELAPGTDFDDLKEVWMLSTGEADQRFAGLGCSER